MQFIHSIHWELGTCRRMAVAVGILLALLHPLNLTAGDRSPHFTGKSMPNPPAQDRAFEMPTTTKLPQVFLTATTALFELGLADPRDCEYREVRLGTGDIWHGDGGVLKVHAWVLPIKDGETDKSQRFAVAWNGLVYPTVDIGEKSDLTADVAAACKADEDFRADWKRDNPGRGEFYRFRNANSEASTLRERELLPIRACLLLRLGETELAERVWSDWTAGMQQNTNDDSIHLNDPYMMLAGDWLWARFDRALTAHMRGDDRLALFDARKLSALEEPATSIAQKRGFDKSRYGKFDFLSPLPKLLADQERRRAEKPRVHVQLPDGKNFPKRAERIAALIADLDEVGARQWGQPGGVALGGNSIVQALIREGDAAVEPLLQCLEKDDRLTRSVHFHRDFFTSRSLIGVHEAAYDALSGIMQESFFVPESTGDDLSSRESDHRTALVRAIRADWKKYGRLPQEERWFKMLSDDSEHPERWIEAVENIVQRVDNEFTPSSIYGGARVDATEYEIGKGPAFRGEALRKKHNPSVADLMAKRLRAIAGGGDDQYSRLLRSSMSLAEALAIWDGKSHLADLRNYADALRARFRESKETAPYLIRPIVELCLRQVELGDDGAKDEYAKWVVTVTREQAQFDTERLFEPMWRFADRPAVAKAAEQMFTREGSPWNPMVSTSDANRRRDHETSPLLGLPVYRNQILRLFDDKSKAGDWDSVSSRFEIDEDDPLKPRQGVMVEYRKCDETASELSFVAGFPRIELYWPLANRDQAVRKSADILHRYGDRLKWNPDRPGFRQFGRPIMTFSRLGGPASVDDVAKGLAIFALDGERRQWAMPEYPLSVRWEALRTSPVTSRTYNSTTGVTTATKSWRNEGFVWQAEEARVDGKWVRWFGFVGPGYLGKAPAAEIELIPNDSWLWSRLSKGVLWRLDLSDRKHLAEKIPLADVKAGRPVSVKLRVMNVLGVDQQVADKWYRAADGSFVEGVTLHMQRANEHVEEDGLDSDKSWDNVISRRGIERFVPENSGKNLRSSEEITPIEINLRTLFSLEKPGYYRVWMSQEKAPDVKDVPATRFTWFEIVKDDAGSRAK